MTGTIKSTLATLDAWIGRITKARAALAEVVDFDEDTHFGGGVMVPRTAHKRTRKVKKVHHYTKHAKQSKGEEASAPPPTLGSIDPDSMVGHMVRAIQKHGPLDAITMAARMKEAGFTSSSKNIPAMLTVTARKNFGTVFKYTPSVRDGSRIYIWGLTPKYANHNGKSAKVRAAEAMLQAQDAARAAGR